MHNLKIPGGLVVALGSLGLVWGDSCSLLVTVVTPDNKALSESVVVETTEPGNIVTRVKTDAGVARFCGLGVGAVVVAVGADDHRCQAIVRDVPLKWKKEVRLKVIYDRSNCDLASPLLQDYGVASGVRMRCETLLRFVDKWGFPIGGVAVRSKTETTEGGVDGVADPFGRLLVNVYSDHELRGEAVAKGYSPSPFKLNCREMRNIREERIVLLNNP